MDATRSTQERENSNRERDALSEPHQKDSQETSSSTSSKPTPQSPHTTPQPPHTTHERRLEIETQAGPALIENKPSSGVSSNELRSRHGKTQLHQEVSSGTSSTVYDNETINGGFYECNICFDTATYPVLTLCGHLFCWSCLAQWLNQQSRNPTCPVCKAGCDKDKIIPIYGRGKEEKDPRNDPSIPTRPAGQRPPPLRDPNTPNSSFFAQPLRGRAFNAGNVTISAGVGLFPFGIAFNASNNNSTPYGYNGHTTRSGFMSRLFLMILTLLIAALIFY
ncbi:hypothetical protein BDF14DRAFT_1863411 [Spinellus fusiger]|nr:hypothetical protein BDF14DRAFT_1863411 [Spinellus fusiger]